MRGIGVVAGVFCLSFCAYAQTDTDGLFQAIRNNDLNYLKAQIEKGADVNTRDRRETTLLMHAAAFGSAEAVKLLLDAGANVNAKNGLDATALLWAAGDPVKAGMLIGKGADVNAQSKQGRTPLMIAAFCDGCSETVRLLLAKGADPHIKDKRGSSALRLAADGGDAESMRLLIGAGAAPAGADGDGITPLLSAVANCDLSNTKYLLSKGADVNAANTFGGEVKFGKIQLVGLTPLMLAAPYCSAEMTRTLLAAGASVNAKDIRDMTPLMLAVATESARVSVVRLLLKAGADTNVKSKMGETALDWANKFGNREILAALTSGGARAGDPFSPPRRPATAASPSVAEAARNGAALLQRSSTEFFKQSGCVGCHHQPITAMAVSAARSNGVPVDESASQQQTKMIEGHWTGVKDIVLERFDLGGLADQQIYSLLALDAAKYAGNAMTDTMAGFVAATQRRDGSWFLGGISRAPMEESNIARTALAMRVLQRYSWPAQKPEFDKRIARARAFLLEAKPSTTDDVAMQLAGFYWAGVGQEKLRAAGRALIAAQRPDGGWGGNRHLASDAFATGESLWALRQAGILTPSDTVYQRGVKFLLRTQWPDGSWYVRSRAPKFQPYFQSGFPFDHDQWISASATGWAVMALAPATEKQHRASR
jgi:ankyrin repeat protein